MRNGRVYVSCGSGFLDIFETKGVTYRRTARIPTGSGARTSLFVPELDRLRVAVRVSSEEPAAIWVFRPIPYDRSRRNGEILSKCYGTYMSKCPLGGKRQTCREGQFFDPKRKCAKPRQIFCSSVQPEKACDKENDDDDADDVENVHGVLRSRHCDFSMKARRSSRNAPFCK
jgi:hypothetical protein